MTCSPRLECEPNDWSWRPEFACRSCLNIRGELPCGKGKATSVADVARLARAPSWIGSCVLIRGWWKEAEIISQTSAQQDRELVQSVYDAYANRDVDGLLGTLHDDFEMPATKELPWGGHFKGRDGMMEFVKKISSHVASVWSRRRYSMQVTS